MTMTAIATARAPRASISDACALLREADRLIARALAIVASTEAERQRGLPSEMCLMLDGRRTGAEARMMTGAAATLRAMPFTAAAFADGSLSWGQVRAIVTAVRRVDASGRRAVDELVGRLARELADADPDELIARVDDEVSRLRNDLTQRREDRLVQRNFLAVQPRLDGSGSFYGEADAQSLATLLEAIDATADRPGSTDGAPTRAQQRFDALLSICEASLSGGQAAARPRPRIYATIDLDSFADGGTAAARVFWNVAGRAPRITPVAADTLLCDASVVPVVFEGPRPIAVGDARAPISSAMRAAIAARDGGCRFPACNAPVSWCDGHHIRSRLDGGPTSVDNLILLCRRCHRRAHRFRWRISLEQDGTAAFTHRGRRFVSPPRARPPSPG